MNWSYRLIPLEPFEDDPNTIVLYVSIIKSTIIVHELSSLIIHMARLGRKPMYLAKYYHPQVPGPAWVEHKHGGEQLHHTPPLKPRSPPSISEVSHPP
jgi:hypothetical protein